MSDNNDLNRSQIPQRILLVFFALFTTAHDSPGAQPTARETDVKATFLFNFSQFVKWPDTAFSDGQAPFVIGILGTNPFGEFLETLVKNERAHGRPIVVKHFARVEESYGSHILFMSRSERDKLDSHLEKLKGRPILTVSETGERRFLRQGGIVGLVTESNRVRLRINLQAARTAQLAIDTKLLRLAEIFPPPPEKL